MDTFGTKIKNLRKSRGVKQKQLADHLKIATSTLSQYENNKRHPNFYLLKEIALFFKVSTDYLLNLETKERSISFKTLKDIDAQLHEDYSFVELMTYMSDGLYDLYMNKDFKSLHTIYHLYQSISDMCHGYKDNAHQQSVEKIISAHQRQKEIIDQRLNLLFRHHLKYYGQ